MDLQHKILDQFIGKVVRKDLAFQVKGNLPVPTYVLEYLLGQYCATDDPEAIEEGLEKTKHIIRTNYVHRAEAEVVKGKIREAGRYRIIDKISVLLNDKVDQYEASFANLTLTNIPIGTEYVRKNPKLLSGNGVWCIVDVGYIPGEDVKVRWEIQNIKPIQISNIDLNDYVNKRKEFTTDEWIDFLIHTVGLNPDNLNRREKFIVLSRLLPHVENNYNFMELGPKGTGKSHVFQELSPYGVLVSGGDVTSARLFVKMSGNKEILGLVGYWDVVAWDEFEQQKGKQIDSVMIDTMQNYLANKSFNRGKATHEATASMSFVGNTKHTVPYMLKNLHLFESIPTAFQKGAFLDRIHLYNPGWEIKMLKKDSFSKSYGLITDYVAAVLHELRKFDYSADLKKYVTFSTTLSERDHNAIRKTFSGLVKLLYPDGNYTQEEALEIIDFAAESRKRVKDQLYVVDETFKAEPAVFEYTKVSDGTKVQVETLERVGVFGMPSVSEPVKASPFAKIGEDRAGDSTPNSSLQTPKSLAAKSIEIRLNQTGVSYKTLFADYLQTAHVIEITDPFIRLPYQVYNLIDFIQMLKETNDAPEELKVILHTNADSDEAVPEMIDIFDSMQDDLRSYSIDFQYDFTADHDRKIVADNGWSIYLGRGLDIFEPYPKFTMGCAAQENRRCRAFSVTYTNQ